MAVLIRIRNVPDSVYRCLKAQAALSGMTLSDYLLEEVRKVADRPTLAELRECLSQQSPARPPISPAAALRAERDAR